MTESTLKALGSDTGGSVRTSVCLTTFNQPMEVILLPIQNIVGICRHVKLFIIYEVVSSLVTLLLASMQD
jgi:hypothetical protein